MPLTLTRGLDNISITCYTGDMMNTNNTKWVQQLKNADPQLWRQVKAQAALDGKSMTQWVEEVVKGELERRKV